MAAEELAMSSAHPPPSSAVMQLSPVRGGGGSAAAAAAVQGGASIATVNASAGNNGDSKSATHSVAKQLNKLKSFLGTLQAYRDPNEDELTLVNRRKRIDVAIDSLVTCAIQIEQFFDQLKASGYPITDSEIAAVHPVVKHGLPLLKAEMSHTSTGSATRVERPYVNDQAPEEPAPRHSSSYDRRRGERQAWVDLEPSAKRQYSKNDAKSNGQQPSRAELHESLQGVYYQLQVLMEQLGHTLYALNAMDTDPGTAMPPGAEVAMHAHGPPPPSAIARPTAYVEAGRSLRPPPNKSTSPPAHISRGPAAAYHIQQQAGPPPPAMQAAPPPSSIRATAAAAHHHQQHVKVYSTPGGSSAHAAQAPPSTSHHHSATSATQDIVKSTSSKLPGASPSSNRKESSKSGKHRDEKKHRSSTTTTTTTETCWSCGAPASETCSRCKKARYCGSVCQRMDWNEKHHRDCKSPNKTSTSGGQ
ncbi:uncharacterized protein LOC135810201 [Sycon ciliatum]|uniref:uncharacterized protein LOC135810201 n=1 Tax=Sycon ciliatum TaxID=27933 RepID=UPI0020AC9868|eukprot:scpid46973/ scgid29674/ Protein CBFA2T2; MTG8-like protein; MTG8-related protein 1